jgi:C4-dicarboxylate-specific signal transduction histidine kinase
VFVSTQNQTQAQEWELKETGTSKEWYIINKTGRVYVTASNSKSPQILFLRFDARNKREKLLILILPGQN